MQDIPIILPGQLYLNVELNEYLIVTQNHLGQIFYEGVGFRGQAEDQTFIERFQPVDPEDVEEAELKELIAFCPEGTCTLVGFTS